VLTAGPYKREERFGIGREEKSGFICLRATVLNAGGTGRTKNLIFSNIEGGGQRRKQNHDNCR